jgi:hypothetical protein
MGYVSGQTVQEMLARADPFDLAQAVERYVSALDREQIRGMLLDAREGLGPYYRAEILHALNETRGPVIDAPRQADVALYVASVLEQEWSREQFQAALTGFLRSNLRAIAIFGNTFALAVASKVPLDRTVAIGEERRRGTPRLGGVLVFGSAIALVAAGAAGEHWVMRARAAAQTPAPPVIVPVVTYVTPKPAPSPSPERTVPPAPTPTPQAAVEAAAPAIAPATPVPTLPPTPRPPTPTPPPGAATLTVKITPPPQTPTPEPTPIDVTDMPQSYSDATPLPQQSTSPADGSNHAIGIVTPTPSPKPRKSWIHRTLIHLNPFHP